MRTMNYLIVSVLSVVITACLCGYFIVRPYHKMTESLIREEGELCDRIAKATEHNMELSIDLYKMEVELNHLKEEHDLQRIDLAVEKSMRYEQSKELTQLKVQNEKLSKELLEQVERQNGDVQ